MPADPTDDPEHAVPPTEIERERAMREAEARALAESGLGSGLLARAQAVEEAETVAVLKICPQCGTEYETAARFCPLDGTALRPHYATVADRIGITALEDDLRHFSPLTASYLTPLPMDAHSAWLHERYDRRRLQLNTSGFFLGRSRVAVL